MIRRKRPHDPGLGRRQQRRTASARHAVVQGDVPIPSDMDCREGNIFSMLIQLRIELAITVAIGRAFPSRRQ